MNETIWSLIVKFMADKLTKSEEVELNEWREENDENKKQFETIKQLLGAVDNTVEEYKPNTLKKWNQLEERINSEKKEIIIISIAQRYWKGIAVALVIILGVAYWGINSNEVDEVTIAMIKIETQDSVKVFFLPDSSKVHLNRGSKMTFPKEFEKKERKVELAGEAYFEIKKNKTKKFNVYAGNTKTTVLGTTFNLKAYEDENEIELTVFEGKVAFEDLKEKEKKTTLKKNEKVTFNKKNSSLKKRRHKGKKFKWWLKNTGKKIENFFKNLGKRKK